MKRDWGLTEHVAVPLTLLEFEQLEELAAHYRTTPEHIARALLTQRLLGGDRRRSAAILAYLELPA